MCGSMADIQSATAEIRREKEEETGRKYICPHPAMDINNEDVDKNSHHYKAPCSRQVGLSLSSVGLTSPPGLTSEHSTASPTSQHNPKSPSPTALTKYLNIQILNKAFEYCLWYTNNVYFRFCTSVCNICFTLIAITVTSGQSNLTLCRITAVCARFNRICQVAPICIPSSAPQLASTPYQW